MRRDGGKFRRSEFFLRADEHGVGEVERGHWYGVRGPEAQQSERHVSGAAANIDDASFGIFEDVGEGARGATPPEAIHIGR